MFVLSGTILHVTFKTGRGGTALHPKLYVVTNKVEAAIRLVEYRLQPLTHKIKHSSARSSHMCILPHPLLTLHSDSRGYRGLYVVFGLLTLLEHVLFKSCRIDSFQLYVSLPISPCPPRSGREQVGPGAAQLYNKARWP